MNILTDNEIHLIDNCDIASSSIDISSNSEKVKLCLQLS